LLFPIPVFLSLGPLLFLVLHLIIKNTCEAKNPYCKTKNVPIITQHFIFNVQPSEEDCARLRLVRFSSVVHGPTSATQLSVQLNVESKTICWRTSDSQICRKSANVFIWSVRPKRSVKSP